MVDILDVFYNSIIKEATTGRIDCSIPFNIPFSTYIYETNEKYECIHKDTELLVPTLIIHNKSLFNELLKKYVELALEFYDDTNFPEEILNYKLYEQENKLCKEKIIMTLLWSNATIDDFKNPNEYLRKRIDFIKNHQDINIQLGYCETLKGSLELKILKDSIMNETPSMLEVDLYNDNGEKYTFPLVKFGIYNNKANIYAIQNKKCDENKYSKQVNRYLFKIGEGFDATTDNYELFEEGNLKDVTASFLVILNICLFYLNSLGIEEISCPVILIERWNAKTMAIKYKEKVRYLNNEQVNSEIDKQEKIWSNINEKLIRTFRRLEYHHESINITCEPFLIDSYLHLNIKDSIVCNNTLLTETANLATQYKNSKKLR